MAEIPGLPLLTTQNTNRDQLTYTGNAGQREDVCRASTYRERLRRKRNSKGEVIEKEIKQWEMERERGEELVFTVIDILSAEIFEFRKPSATDP